MVIHNYIPSTQMPGGGESSTEASLGYIVRHCPPKQKEWKLRGVVGKGLESNELVGLCQPKAVCRRSVGIVLLVLKQAQCA